MSHARRYRKKSITKASVKMDSVTPSLRERRKKVDDYDLDGNEPASDITQLSGHDRWNFAMLCLLYLLQGVPVGLAFGSIPFVLKTTLSYGQVGVFSLASYPYSLKLLWSPVIDAVFSNTLGRRKSWVIPIQTLSAILLIFLGKNIGRLMADPETHLYSITGCFFILVMLCATQDIAVDGWALTLLSARNLSYASTAQTIGLNTGYFLSFTVFLAFNSPEFANKYFRKESSEKGLVSLQAYLTFWGWLYLLVTLCLLFFKKERTSKQSEGVMSVYRSMKTIVQLPHIQTFMIVHLVAKFGFQANEAVTNLKLLERGLSKEDLALTVLIDFPFEIIFGYYAAKWSAGHEPLRPWLWAYLGRLAAAGFAQLTIYLFPSDGKVGNFYFSMVIAEHVFGSFMSTIQFVSVNAFHTQISDPYIGGTYMTLLNTLSNLGGTWPRLFIMNGVDYFTRARCVGIGTRLSCVTEAERAQCRSLGGYCQMSRDGYYVMNILCILTGLFLFITFIRPSLLKLQALPIKMWRVA